MNNPLAKGGLVLSLMAIAVGFVGVIVLSFNHSTHRSPNQPDSSATASETSPDVDPEQTEIARLKALNALGSQAQILNQSPTATPARMAPPATNAKANGSHPVSPARATPAPRPQTPIAYTPQPSYTPRVRTVASSPAPVRNIASRAGSTTPAVKPEEAWQNALQVGSFGGEEGTQMAIASDAQPQEATPNSAQTNPVAQPVDDARYEADAAALLAGIPRRAVTITPSTTAAATLTTPVVWAQDLDAAQQPQRFGLQLTQPLYAADGSVALSAGTQMVAKVDAISESGMMQLSVIAVITPTEAGNQVVELPPGALLIAGKAGEPLMAENRNANRRHIASRDINIALMGALSQVGSLLNRPDNQTTMTSPYLSTTSIRNGQTNIVGGLLQGAFTPLIQQTQERQQREIEEILRRPNLWYIPSGQELQIFANSSFEVSL